MLIDLFRATVRAVTFLHLNTCSKLRKKYSNVCMREIASNNNPYSYSPCGVADEGAGAALATALHISLFCALFSTYMTVFVSCMNKGTASDTHLQKAY